MCAMHTLIHFCRENFMIYILYLLNLERITRHMREMESEGEWENNIILCCLEIWMLSDILQW